MSKEPKQINFEDLRRADRPELEDVWVMNRTGRGGKLAGNLAITVTANGTQQSLVIPATWIPLNLSEEIGTEFIIKEPNFRRELQIGRLTLHDSAECKEFMKDPDAQQEYMRIREMQSDVENTINSSIEVFSERLTQSDQPTMEIASNRIQSEEQAQSANAPGSVGVLTLVVQTLNDDDTTDAQKMNTLRTNQDQLSDVDLKYIVKKSSNQNLQGWARNLLKERNRTKEETKS